METRLSPDDRDAGRPLASGLWATALLVLVLLIAGNRDRRLRGRRLTR
jgi:hypothetical protein